MVSPLTHTPGVGKLGDLQAALQSFERSLELAVLLEDSESQSLIKRAMEDINSRIASEIQPNDEGTPSD